MRPVLCLPGARHGVSVSEISRELILLIYLGHHNPEEPCQEGKV